MNLLEETLRMIPDGIKESEEIRTVGNSVYILLSTGNKIKIYLTDVSVHHHWDTLVLELINPQEGKVDITYVEFKYIIGNYYIWDYPKMEWYHEPSARKIEEIQDEVQNFYSVYEPVAVENTLK